MRISDWSSDVCSSDLTVSRNLPSRPKSSLRDQRSDPMNELQLQPPAATPAAQSDEFTLDAKAAARLKAVAREFAGSCLAFDVHNPEFVRSVRQITPIGSEEVRKLQHHARLPMNIHHTTDRRSPT